MFNEIISNRFQNLQNAGMLTGADAVGQVGSVSVGTMVKIYLRIDNGVITEAKFKTFGGVIALVASDVVCDLLKNCSIENALLIKSKDIIKILHDVPSVKLQVVDLVQSAVVDAVDDYYKKLSRIKMNEKK